MFLPTGDAPNYSHARPWVNWGLIATNVAVWLYGVAVHGTGSGYQAWILSWGFVPVDPSPATWFTSMFLHGGFGHLAGNMLFLFVFGDNVEGRLGHLGYLLAYLACGLAAVLLFQGLAPDSTVPLVGASGAIFGIEGFYFLAFPRNRVRVIYFFFLIGVAWIPARIMLGLSFVLNLVYMLTPAGQMGGGGVAYAAHVGGFVFGVGLALSVRWLGPTEEVLPVPGRGRPAAPGAPELLAAARRLVQAGRYEEAQVALVTVLRDHLHQPQGAEAAFQLGMLLARVQGRPEAAREPLRFAARFHPDPGVRAEATGELERLGEGEPPRDPDPAG